MEYAEFEEKLLDAGADEIILAGGQFPFQAEGTFKDFGPLCFYFRAHDEHWSFTVYPTVKWCEDGEFDEELYFDSEEWGEGVAAGLMTYEEALPIILGQFKAFAESQVAIAQ